MTRLRFCVFVLVLAGVFATVVRSQDPLPPVLKSYQQRLDELPSQTPAVVASAEAAAQRVLANPQTSLVISYAPNATEFANELLGRAGGLSKALGSPPKREGDKPVVLVAVRSWELEGAAILSKLAAYHDKGCLVTVFAPHAGQPTNAVADFWIDNGGNDTNNAAATASINMMANVTLGWMWCCEYATALSRHGKYPGVLRTMMLQDSKDQNQPLQTPEGRAWLGNTDHPVAAGKLAALYLDRAQKLVTDLRQEAFRSSLQEAAALAATRIQQGKKVFVAGAGHIITGEIFRHDMKSVLHPLQPHLVATNASPGDLLIWIGYIGQVGTTFKGTDQMARWKQKNLDVIFCAAPSPDASNTSTGMLSQVAWDVVGKPPTNSPVVLTLNQLWGLPDAEISIPWPPERMAPVSGLNALLVMRLLDDAIQARLAAPPKPPSKESKP